MLFLHSSVKNTKGHQTQRGEFVELKSKILLGSMFTMQKNYYEFSRGF